MDKEFVTLEIAEAFKKLGFDEECLASWNNNEKYTVNPLLVMNSGFKNTNHPIGNPCAPLRQQAFRWLRDKYQYMHDIDDVAVMTSSGNGYRFKYAIWKILGTYESLVYDDSALGYLTYEDAEIACLKHIIKLIINKSNE